MAETARQKRVTGRVMHEFKHGELKSGPGGKGGPVKSPRQAIAIALEEAGASRYESESRNERNLRLTEQKEAKGETAQQERGGTVAHRRLEQAREYPLDGRQGCSQGDRPSSEGCQSPRTSRRRRTWRPGAVMSHRRPFKDNQTATG